MNGGGVGFWVGVAFGLFGSFGVRWRCVRVLQAYRYCMLINCRFQTYSHPTLIAHAINP